MQPELNSVTDLIGRIYDCSIEPSRWPSVLGEICQHMNGLCAEVQSYDPTTFKARLVYTHGWPDELRALTEKYVSLSPVAPFALVAPLDEPMWSERVFGFEAMERSQYYQLSLGLFGHRDYIHVPLVRNVTEMTGWGVTSHRSQGPFREEHVEFARLLSPHIKRSLRISGLLAEKQVEATGLHGVLDALPCFAVLVNRTGSVIYRNAAALASNALITIERGQIGSRNAHVVALLEDLRNSIHLRGRDVEIQDASGTITQVTWIAVPKTLGGDDLVLVLVRTPAAELHTPLGTATKLFNLTLAESQVLAALLQGDTLEDASARIGKSRSTIKTHLESIFAKSGVNRQADLIRRVMELKTPFG